MSGNATLERLLSGNDLTQDEAAALLRSLATGELDAALAGGLLVALRAKGESADEIRGFALAMRELALRPDIPPGPGYVDVVGTGGDGSGSLNLSTGSALLAAACGVQVVKHGNRSITSRSGSADVLAALGLPVPLDASAAGQCLAELGFTFLFAPHYHPAMKHIAPIRLALGVRTVFNVLGPLVNPAAPPYHVIGAANEDIAALMAATLADMPIARAFVIHGANGWDEATPIGPFVLFDVRDGRVERSTRDPAQWGIERCAADALAGGEAELNAARLRSALEGGDSAAHRDALIIGAALTLEVTGAAASFAAGIEQAQQGLVAGRGRELLARLDRFEVSV